MRKRVRKQLKLPDWPTIDRALWERAITPADFFEAEAGAAKWRPATRLSVTKSYGGWLGWLRARRKLDAEQHPADRAAPEVVGAYALYLRSTSASGTVASHLQHLAMALTAMAPERGWAWLWNAVNLANRVRVPVREKRDRIVPEKELRRVALALMQGEPLGDSLLEAVRFRDGLMIMLLATRPIRIKNLHMMQIGRHLVPTSVGFDLRFEAVETKNARPINLPMPVDMREQIEVYLQIHRPILLAHGNAPAPQNSFWLTRFGKPFSINAIRARLIEVTEKHLGKPVTPHLFRHCIATTVALDDPGHLDIIMSLLGHSCRSTAERYYIHAQCQQAAGLYQKAIRAMRNGHKAEERRQRRMNGSH
jgi:integrase/recombinase XerD